MPPTDLLLVRHGESVGNVASAEAWAAKAETIDIDIRDPDVPLSPLGERQARAFGKWLAEQPDFPAAVWSSPYLRARETVAIALEEAGRDDVEVLIDERLRDRELGILDRLTARGIEAKYPDERARRRYLGKMYYRPPGGESWADVALRLRGFLRDLLADAPSGLVLIAAHDAVILLIRYVLTRMTEEEVLKVAAEGTVANASVTTLHREADGSWTFVGYQEQEVLQDEGVPATAQPRESDVRGG
jgi:broad specificity phosphatase PhoE